MPSDTPEFSHDEVGPQTLELLQKGMTVVALHKVFSGAKALIAYTMGDTEGASQASEALRFKDEAEVRAGDAILPTATLRARLTRAYELVSASTSQESTVGHSVRDRARTLLAYAGACVDMGDQDYRQTQFPCSFTELASVASAVLRYEESANLGGVDDINSFMQQSVETDAAGLMVRDAFIAASMEEGL